MLDAVRGADAAVIVTEWPELRDIATEELRDAMARLAREGFDPRLVTDPLFFREPASGAYRELAAANYARILNGSIRL